MGNCFSDPSAKKESKKGGHVLGSAPASSKPAQATINTGTPHTTAQTAVHTTGDVRPGQMLGDGFEDSNRNRDPREMARQAAEERIKAVSISVHS
jgi:uncharacterized protein (DUF1501 family)